MRVEILITEHGISWVRDNTQHYIEGVPKEIAVPVQAITDFLVGQRTEEEVALEAARDYASALPDKDKLSLVAVFPRWEVGVKYAVGDERAFGDKLYRCLQAHVSQADWEPARTPALWRDIAKGDKVAEWVRPTGAHDAYQKGERVVYKGETWESVIADNVWSPDEYPAGWTK